MEVLAGKVDDNGDGRNEVAEMERVLEWDESSGAEGNGTENEVRKGDEEGWLLMPFGCR